MERVNLRRLPDDWTADEEALAQAIDDATATPIYITYRLAGEWFDGLHESIDELERSISARPSVALALIERTFLRLDRAVGAVDDSDGGMVDACTRLAALHATAAERAGLTAGETSERIEHLNSLDLRPFEAA